MTCGSETAEVAIISHWIEEAIVLCTVPGNLFSRPHYSAHEYFSHMGTKTMPEQ
jgi:hypothetical protein